MVHKVIRCVRHRGHCFTPCGNEVGVLVAGKLLCQRLYHILRLLAVLYQFVKINPWVLIKVGPKLRVVLFYLLKHLVVYIQNVGHVVKLHAVSLGYFRCGLLPPSLLPVSHLERVASHRSTRVEVLQRDHLRLFYFSFQHLLGFLWCVCSLSTPVNVHVLRLLGDERIPDRRKRFVLLLRFVVLWIICAECIDKRASYTKRRRSCCCIRPSTFHEP